MGSASSAAAFVASTPEEFKSYLEAIPLQQREIVKARLQRGLNLTQGPRITYISDVEGHWPYFCNFVETSKAIHFAKDGDPREARTDDDLELVLDNGSFFVFGGDACDKGPGTLRFLKAMVMLKKKYPERVILILGNRDINKMRWTAELAKSELELSRVKAVPCPFWIPKNGQFTYHQYLKQLAADEEKVAEDKVTDDMLVKYSNKANKLRCLLDHDMGSRGEFDFRRQELAHLRNVGEDKIDDDAVVRSYEESLEPGGCMREYLELAQLGVIIGTTLFVHGQILNGSDPETATSSLGVVPGVEERIPEIFEWIDRLNAWAAQQIKEWKEQPTWTSPPKEPTREEWAARGASELIAYGTPGTRGPTVVYARYLTKDSMPIAYPAWLVAELERQGVQQVVVGHTPHGNAPTVVKTGNVTLIMSDTSFSHMKSDLAYKGDNRGRAVSELCFDGSSWMVRGQTEKADQLFEFEATTPLSHFSVLGHTVNCKATGKDFFIKAPLHSSNFLLTHIKGFTYEYAVLPELQLKTAFAMNHGLWISPYERSNTVLPAHDSRYSDMVEDLQSSVLFESMDANKDGKVTIAEILDALMDRCGRYQLQGFFPEVDLAEVFTHLGKMASDTIAAEDFVLACQASTPSEEKGKKSLTGIFFPVVESGEGFMEGEFPKSLQSFDMVPTGAIEPSHLLSMCTEEPEKWKRHHQLCQVALGEAAKTDVKLVKLGESSTHCVSCLRLVTVLDKEREILHIPRKAKYFVWMYGATQHFDWDKDTLADHSICPDLALIRMGGFVYLDASCKPIQINALVPRSGASTLRFGRPQVLSPEWVKKEHERGKFCPVTIPSFLEAGASDFCWLEVAEDGEEDKLAPVNKHGGFAYIGYNLHTGKH